MSELEKEIERVRRFVDDYRTLGDGHMVSFFTDNYYDTIVMPSAREQLDSLTSDDILRLRLVSERLSECSNERNKIGDVNDFYQMTKSMSVTQADSLEHAKEQLDSHHPILDENNLKVKDLPTKKVHEVSRMANLVADVAAKVGTRKVIDIGAGKGYLSTFLAAEYGLEVTAIDCVKKNLDQLEKRARLMSKYYGYRVAQEEQKKTANKYEIEIKCIPGTVRPGWLPDELDGEYVLVGLHCCGDLSSVLAELAINNAHIVGLVLVPCCYHHLTEVGDGDAQNAPVIRNQFETGLARGLDQTELTTTELDNELYIGFPLSEQLKATNVCLGRNTRMLACHSRDRTQAAFNLDKDLTSTMAVYYRALLRELMMLHFDARLIDQKVGKIYAKVKGKVDPFVAYCRLAFDKFGIDDHRNIISDADLTEFYEKRTASNGLQKLRQFEALRECYSAAPESLIVLDKLKYLRDAAKFDHVNLVKVFDPIKSPRAFAYIAH